MRKLLKFLFILFLGVISCACVNMFAVHELNQKAIEYLEDGDVKSAISRLESSIDLDGNVYESRYNLAAAYIQEKEYEKALENIKIAKEINPKEPIAFYTHAVASIHVADSLYQIINENGEVQIKEFPTKDDEKKAKEYHIKLLSDANESFEKYMQLAPNADDTHEIIDLINENNNKIQELKEEISN